MNVIVNNEKREIPDSQTISQLLLAASITAEKGVAVAVNDQVIRKAKWISHVLKENDKVTIIRATQGG